MKPLSQVITVSCGLSGDLFGSMIKYTSGIRYALALIREADYVVANDSGLAHAAAAR